MNLPILTYPHKNLRLKSKEVNLDELKSKEIQRLIDNMKQTMLEEDGVGLAAPQVDKQLRIVVVNTQDSVKEFINPKIVKKSWAKNIMEEGCLSVPHVYGLVKRPKRVKVKYLDRQGKQRKLADNEILARVLQHEVDHLDGVLFIDKVMKITHGEDKLEQLKELSH